MRITELRQIDTNGDGYLDKQVESWFRYRDGLLESESQFINNPAPHENMSWGVDYTYNEHGQEVFREIQTDPIGGGIPSVARVTSTYDARGFKVFEKEDHLVWADPDENVWYEVETQTQYRDDGQQTFQRTDYISYGHQSPIDWREERWTYTDFDKVASHTIEDYSVFNVPLTRFYNYNLNEQLSNVRLQDEWRFGDDRPRVVESFSYKEDGSLKEHTHWGAYTEFGWAPWQQTQMTHISPTYDKITTLIDLTGDFKFDYKVVEDTWRNADLHDTHILTSRYDAAGKLLGRDLITQTFNEWGLASQIVDYGNDGNPEEVMTRTVDANWPAATELLVA